METMKLGTCTEIVNETNNKKQSCFLKLKFNELKSNPEIGQTISDLGLDL